MELTAAPSQCAKACTAPRAVAPPPLKSATQCHLQWLASSLTDVGGPEINALPVSAMNSPYVCREEHRRLCVTKRHTTPISPPLADILDVLFQRRRDRRAAVKLMRKLLRKQGFAPKTVTT